ncbi:MAG: hypothetical protein HY056_06355, partial [Proteobacteria bacterium]|nr:hypothetical protein [Pseudomonadota bacterium]
MSISRRQSRRAAPPKHGATGKRPAHADGAIPATVSRPALLDRGCDKRFRALIYDLMTIATRMNAVREHLARR